MDILLFAISIAIICIVSGLMDNSAQINHFNSSTECADISSNLEHSDTHSFEDFVVIIESKHKLNNPLNDFCPIPAFSDNLKNNYISKIWQPPKNS
jgi:hypothetical protein